MDSEVSAEYRARLARHRAAMDLLERRLGLAGNTRFGLVALGGLLVWLWAVERAISGLWLLPVLAAFAVLSVATEVWRRRLAAAARLAARHEVGLSRLAGEWAGQGVTGDSYRDNEHPCAADLDLFGVGSVFERLCDAASRAGRDTLAGWLLAPAPPADVRARQEAVRELAPRLDWRDRLALLGAGMPFGIDTAALSAWASAGGGSRGSEWPRIAAPLLASATVLSATAWYLEVPLGSLLFLIAITVQGAFASWVRPRVTAALAGLDGRYRDLMALRGLLATAESEAFTAPRLVALQGELRTAGVPPSRRLAQLLRLVALRESPRNLLFAPIAPFLLWTTQIAFAIEEWRRATGPALPRWAAAVGELEALASLAGYAHENPTDVFPEVVDGAGPFFEAEALAHPLLAREQAIANDLTLGPGLRLLVVSGSNMSGKSTFLRSVGLAAVLAQAGAPVRATRCRLSPLAVGATLRVEDSLRAGRSRFFAEITRLRQVLEMTRGPVPVLFLLDELLNGTNSHDRRAGAEAVVARLLRAPCIGLLTTHDLALTALADRFAPAAANVHFADDLAGRELHFDYRLRPGIVTHGNALALMRAVGLLEGEA